jgi:hypothetical protein
MRILSGAGLPLVARPRRPRWTVLRDRRAFGRSCQRHSSIRTRRLFAKWVLSQFSDATRSRQATVTLPGCWWLRVAECGAGQLARRAANQMSAATGYMIRNRMRLVEPELKSAIGFGLNPPPSARKAQK